MKRPERLVFLPVSDPSLPIRLSWDPPAHAVQQIVVLSTPHPFPPEMAGEYFSGRMDEFVGAERLGPEAQVVRVQSPAAFYAVLSVTADDEWIPVVGLREVSEGFGSATSLVAVPATQTRTFSRVRWAPPSNPDSHRVGVFLCPADPDGDELRRMLTGDRRPDVVLEPPLGDGFIDTCTAEGFRVHYVAVLLLDEDERVPMRLSVGAYQTLYEPHYLEPDGPARARALMTEIVTQLRAELDRHSLKAAEFQEMLDRARDLAPEHPELEAVTKEAFQRFGQAF